jgi:hypothetical protein
MLGSEQRQRQGAVLSRALVEARAERDRYREMAREAVLMLHVRTHRSVGGIVPTLADCKDRLCNEFAVLAGWASNQSSSERTEP